MNTAYVGKILHVDLSESRSWIEEPPDSVYRTYMGGSALGSYFLLRDLKPGTDPLGPDNLFMVMTGVLCGLPLDGTSRYSVLGKSPLTGGFGESEAGGYWGPELKRAGLDGIIVHGKAVEPVYLLVADGGCEIRSASKIWGALSGEVEDELVRELGDKNLRILQTGVAGENGVLYAGLTNNLKHFHGRTGLGAVMASKNLKAIVAKGNAKPVMHDAEAGAAVRQWLRDNFDRSTDNMHLYGTARAVLANDAAGMLPTRNFKKGSFENAEPISGETMADTILTKRGTCLGCGRLCKREVEVPERDVSPRYGGPEYETIGSLGSMCEVSDLAAVAEAGQWCNRYVMDTISAGVTIAFAMECYENGIITKEDTDGIELEWGNGDAVIAMIHKIAKREGIGDILADGVKKAAERLGKGSEQYALHVKGQEVPMHEPRGKASLALHYALSPTGADHLEADHDVGYLALDNPEGPQQVLGLFENLELHDLGPKKVRAFFYSQSIFNFYNCVGLCDFIGTTFGHLPPDMLRDFLQAATGWRTSIFEMQKVGERANTMARIFNLREGFTTADDTLPPRLFEPLENGANEGRAMSRDELSEALSIYYEMAGWGDDGVPTKGKLADLSLEWLEGTF